jgi:hypothetical protein
MRLDDVGPPVNIQVMPRHRPFPCGTFYRLQVNGSTP